MAFKKIIEKYIPLPSDESIRDISRILLKQAKRKETIAKYAPMKDVLALIGQGALLSAVFLVPNSAKMLPLLKKSPDWDVWKQYNVSYLQRTLRRLSQQKQIEVSEVDGSTVVRLTKLGKRKILKYSLETLSVEKPDRWDKKWRLVLYDIPSSQRELSEIIRETLRTFGFYKIQGSVYVYPYPCFEQIEFLRQYYALGDLVQYMLVDKIEYDEAYKIYFGLA